MRRAVSTKLFEPIISFDVQQRDILFSFENNERSFVKLSRGSGMTTMLTAHAFKEALNPNSNIVIVSPNHSMAHHTRNEALQLFHSLQNYRQKIYGNLRLDFDIEYNSNNSMIIIKTVAGRSAIFNKSSNDELRGLSISHLLYDDASMTTSNARTGNRNLEESMMCNAPRVEGKIIIAGDANLNASLWSSRGYIDAKFGNLKQIYKELAEIG